jgi:hypothetical protein
MHQLFHILDCIGLMEIKMMTISLLSFFQRKESKLKKKGEAEVMPKNRELHLHLHKQNMNYVGMSFPTCTTNLTMSNSISL